MPIYAKAGEKKFYAPAPEGTQQGVCVDVIDLGMKPNAFKNGELQHKIRIIWQIDELREDGLRFTVGKQYTLSLHEKATLRRDLEAWRGKKFTEDDLKGDGFDVEKLVGANALLAITHERSSTDPTKVFANVTTISPLLKNMPKLAMLGYERKPTDPVETPDVDTAQMPTADEVSF